MRISNVAVVYSYFLKQLSHGLSQRLRWVKRCSKRDITYFTAVVVLLFEIVFIRYRIELVDHMMQDAQSLRLNDCEDTLFEYLIQKLKECQETLFSLLTFSQQESVVNEGG